MSGLRQDTSERELLECFVREAMHDPRAPASPGGFATDVGAWMPPGGVLLVRLGGIEAAVPAAQVSGMSRYEGALPARVCHRGRQLRVVDPASLLADARAAGRGYLLIVNGADLALPCDELQGRLELRAGDLRPARPSLRRAWLSGVIEDDARWVLHLPALLATLPDEPGTDSASYPTDAIQRQNIDTSCQMESER